MENHCTIANTNTVRSKRISIQSDISRSLCKSLVVFLALDPLSNMPNTAKYEFKIKNPQQSYINLLFTDDLKLYAAIDHKIKALLHIT
jgi:hypothetical protein